MANLADLLFRAVDGVFAVDAKQKIIFWSPSCAQLFGIPCNEALGRRCSAVVRGKDPAGQPFCGEGCCVSRMSQSENPPEAFPLRVRKNDGNEMRLSVSIVLVPSRSKDRWTCVHLLHRGKAADTLDMLEYNTSLGQPVSGRSSANNGDSLARITSLTSREEEILQLLSEGLTVSVISDLLNISRVTVRNHLQHIQVKLGVHSQVETVAYAYRHNLVHY
jgi:PAS domain S-box-containing protein